MKNIVSRLQQHPKYESVLHWGKLISLTGSAQLIVQAVGFACGILIIRLLPVQEYAYYTLANTMLGTMVVLADGGISTGVMAQGGKVWQDKTKLGIVLATGLDLRRKFALGSLVVSVPVLLYLLMHNGASILTAVLISLALIPAFYAALSDSLLEIVPKLHQSIIPLQKNQVAVGIGRLILTVLTILIFPWAFIAILAAGLTRIWGNMQLRKIVFGLASQKQQPDQVVRKEVLSIVKRRMPESIYFCLSGQINIWLISLFGTSTSLASLGALGRFSMITSFFTVLFLTLITPRLAKMANFKVELRNKILKITVLLFLFSIFIISIAFIFSNQFLWILGNNYYRLNREFLLIVVASCISLFQGVFFSINSSRGWVIPPIIYITLSIITTILSLIYIDISTLAGVVVFTISISTIQVFVLVAYCFHRISNL